MVTQVVTLKKVFKETGVSQKTGKAWTRFDVVDTNDVRYKTFNFQLGQQAENAEGQTVGLQFHTEQQGNYSNNILDSIDLNGHNGHSGEPVLQQDPTVKHAVYSKAEFEHLDLPPAPAEKQRQINRSAALNRVIHAVEAGVVTWAPGTDPKVLFRICDEYVKYIEQGSEAFGQF